MFIHVQQQTDLGGIMGLAGINPIQTVHAEARQNSVLPLLVSHRVQKFISLSNETLNFLSEYNELISTNILAETCIQTSCITSRSTM